MPTTNYDEVVTRVPFPASQLATDSVTTPKIAAGAVTVAKLDNPTGNAGFPVQATRFEYDFAVDGGLIGNIDLAALVPANALVLGGMLDVITTLTTAGADAGTIAVTLGAQAANLIVAAIAVSNGAAPWAAGRQAIIPAWTKATAVKATAQRAVRIVIAGQNVTAGKFVGWLFWVQSE